VQATGDTPVLIVDCAGTRQDDLALVDALARLRLVVQRRGWAMRLRGASDELRELVELAGLADVLPLETRREAERGEELRVQEVVEPRDPPV
jgi:anti-anti-sigma regulatory factor